MPATSPFLSVALIQRAIAADAQTNRDNFAKDIRDAARQGARVIVLPELHNGPYFCQTEDTACFDLAEPIPGPSTGYFAKLAEELEVVIVTSLFERRAAGLYHNTAVVLDVDGSIAGMYRKMHIPDDPGYYEKFYFTPGDLGFEPIRTKVATLGVLVCWDQWYPEAARLMALAGADLLIYPTAIGWDMRDTAEERARQREAWITVQRGHAIANGTPVISCNRVGIETGGDATSRITFWGSSFIAGPQGEFFAEAPHDTAATLISKIDFRRVEDVRRIWPFFRDRRIDAYADIRKRFRD